ncbi:MAG TPA: PQQ-binding-like beta-propeller repeat protein [Vicinamibacterales bacterium]|nr:PQQ-binding-like beta-propeller repeat protein [Vicinamibacterales bacterium]
MRFLALLVTLLAAPVASAQDWNQWRGPSRDGAVPASLLPRQWPATVQPSWQVEVGEGYASPVVAAGRVFVHSRRDPDEIVTAIDVSTGKVAWQQTYQAQFAKNQYASRMAKGPNSTPLASGSRVYTLGVTGILTAWNAADGTVAWRNDYSKSIDTSKLFCGTAMSPLIEGGSLIVQVGSDVHGGRILALDPGTGKEKWAWNGPGPGYASPALATIDGVRQIITLTNASIVGIDAATGAGLWSIPFTDEWHENIVTPIWTGSALLVSGVRQGTQAYAISRAGTWQTRQLWKNAEVTMYTSSPVLIDGVLYGLSNKRRGQLVALRVEDGAMQFSTPGRDGNHASIQHSGDRLLILADGGVLIVARRTPEGFAEERRYEVAKQPTWAQPVFLADGLLVRDATTLQKLRW